MDTDEHASRTHSITPDPDPEPHCPLCDDPLGIEVEAWHHLPGEGAVSQSWKVMCEGGGHVVINSWEWLSIAYEAAVIAEQRGEDPDEAMAAYWRDDEWAGDDNQPMPDPDLLMLALRERGCFGRTYAHLSAQTINPSAVRPSPGGR